MPTRTSYSPDRDCPLHARPASRGQLAIVAFARVQMLRTADCQEPGCGGCGVRPPSAQAARTQASHRLRFRCRVVRLASFYGSLRAGVFIDRQFSRIVPAHPRSLARCFSRAPSPRAGDPDSAAHRVLLFPDSSPNQVRWVPTPENAPSALGAGHIHHPSTRSARAPGPRYSRRFAQECPESNPGPIQPGELIWRFTKTKSRFEASSARMP